MLETKELEGMIGGFSWIQKESHLKNYKSEFLVFSLSVDVEIGN